MAEKLKIWFDAEADFLEVRFSDAPGYSRETSNDRLMERVDEGGRVLGFTVQGVSTFRHSCPLEAELAEA
jgi:hypothetical protein